jgi:hypothetical protein
MKLHLGRSVLFAIVLLLTATIARDQVSTTRDGNWWIEQDQSEKLSYMTGFFDGIELGKNFSYWGYMDEMKAKKPDAVSAMAKTVASFDEYSEKYLSTVTTGQVAEGLDKLYVDYRNRSIRVSSGVWLVLNSISGKSDAEMQKLTESFRKNAKN